MYSLFRVKNVISLCQHIKNEFLEIHFYFERIIFFSKQHSPAFLLIADCCLKLSFNTMNIKLKVISFLWLIFCLVSSTSAQQGFVSSGGNTSNPNGSVAYSIGQVAFETAANETGSVNPGIQQPFQVTIVGVSNHYPDPELLLYPNPASHQVYLQLSGDENIFGSGDYTARICDDHGKLLITQALKNDINMIFINDLPSAIYFIQIWKANTLIQSSSFYKTN